MVASSWHFTSFHEEDARSNNPQIQQFYVSHILRIISLSETPPTHTHQTTLFSEDITLCSIQAKENRLMSQFSLLTTLSLILLSIFSFPVLCNEMNNKSQNIHNCTV